MSEDMAPELQALLVRISNMADLMLGGWTPKEYDDLVTLQGFLKIKLIENPSTRPEDKVIFESAAKALEKFMGPYIG